MPPAETMVMPDLSAAEALALLALQIEWGADEALDAHTHDRLARPVAAKPPAAIAASPIGGNAGRAEAMAAAAESLEQLRAAMLSFDGCALRDTASHSLFAEGDPGGGLMLIGEVPDADEDRAGRLFAGASGDLLDRMLASIGLSRAQLLIAPLIPWRPPGDRRVSPAEMAACLPFLHRLVALARPRRLLLMGVRPARALLASEAPLSRLRGRWLSVSIPGSPPLPCLPMRHPSQLLATPPARREAWHDLLLLAGTLSQGGEKEVSEGALPL